MKIFDSIKPTFYKITIALPTMYTCQYNLYNNKDETTVSFNIFIKEAPCLLTTRT